MTSGVGLIIEEEYWFRAVSPPSPVVLLSVVLWKRVPGLLLGPVDACVWLVCGETFFWCPFCISVVRGC